ncbi:Glycogen synthase [Kocuria rosea]|nr:Glycogen synthase [Kocuria rosea]
MASDSTTHLGAACVWFEDEAGCPTSGDGRPLVLMLHASYRCRGGEETSLEAEAACFQELGYRVRLFTRDNSSVRNGVGGALRALFDVRTFWEVRRECIRHKPTIVYVNNLWPSLSASALLAVRLQSLPTLQALHNYRLVTPSARLDDAGACAICGSTRLPFGCIVHRCYRSLSATALCALASAIVRFVVVGWRHHWYLTPSEASRHRLVKGGLRSSRFLVRRNFLLRPGPLSEQRRNAVSFVGRLSEEKGIAELVRNWPLRPGFPVLEVIGEGPLYEQLSSLSTDHRNVRLLGAQTQPTVLELMASSLLTAVPSMWAEPFGLVALESMSVGTPVLTTGHGGLAEIVGDTGVLLDTCSADRIESVVDSVLNPVAYARLVQACRSRAESDYSLTTAASEMQNILRSVLAAHPSKGSRP